MLHSNQIVVGLLGLGGTMDKQARKERIENMITMAEAFHTFEELLLPGPNPTSVSPGAIMDHWARKSKKCKRSPIIPFIC
jgi:hypothetical protein